MKRFTVYALADPRTAIPHYVGATTRAPSIRLVEHRCHAHRRDAALAKWLSGLSKTGLAPTIVILETDVVDGAEAEKRWISYFRQAKAPLFNKADGGQGPSGFKHSAIWKRENAKRNLGKEYGEETRAKISASKVGKSRPDLAQRNKAGAFLADEQVALIRNRLAQGDKGAAIAVEFGISKALVSLIKNNKRRS